MPVQYRAEIAVANEPVGCVLLWLRMPKWKSWIRITSRLGGEL